MSKYWTILALVIFLSCLGCETLMVEEEEAERIPSRYAADYDRGVPLKVVENKPPRYYFTIFRRACLQGNWSLAYSLLSERWQKSKTIEEFTANMKDIGNNQLQEKVISTTNIKDQTGVKSLITTKNQDNQQTQYLLVKQGASWKIAGVRNLPAPKNVKSPKNSENQTP